jgi:Stress responsive A/B Barrel Domain
VCGDFFTAGAIAILSDATIRVMPHVKHIALFRFKPECTPDDLAAVWAAIENLPKQIPGIVNLSRGPDISTEGLSDGFTDSFVMTFESVEARDRYLPHPAHQAAVKIVMPKLERVIVVDHAA